MSATGPNLRIISLGAGVQSTTMLLMAIRGEFGAVPDAAIFADTGWEPAGVYRHLEWLEATAGQVIPILRVSAGNIREDTIRNADGEGTRFASLPFHLRDRQTHKPGMIRRQCTSEYKLQPLQRRTREMLKAAGVKCAEMWIGISLDEAHRMRDSRVKYIQNCYPLVDRRMSRHDCMRWLTANGYPIPPKSACIACPFHDDRAWRDMRDNRPDEWRQAVEFDAAVRTLPRIEGEVFLHRSLRPLPMVDLSTPADFGQGDLFGNECEGMCGV